MKKQKIYRKKFTEEEKEEIRRKYQEYPPEGDDIKAIIIAAIINILPVVLLTLGIFVFIIWFFFLR